MHMPAESDATPPERDKGGFDPASAYLDRLGEGSRRTMREALSKLAGWASDGRCDLHELPWHALRFEHTEPLRTRLAETLAPATANKHLAALRGVLKQCLEKGLIAPDEYHRAIDLPTVKGASPRAPKRLSAHEIERLMRVCSADRSPAGARDAALLALLRRAGLRRSEAVQLTLADYDVEKGILVFQRVNGGAKRQFLADDTTRGALERWILMRGPQPGPFFNPVNKGGRIDCRSLSEQAIYIACQKRAGEAGLPPTSPEDLRRAAIERAQPASGDAEIGIVPSA
jgi:integrase